MGPNLIQLLVGFGASIVSAVTKNPTAIKVAQGVVTIEPSIESAINVFESLFSAHHNAQAQAAQQTAGQ